MFSRLHCHMNPQKLVRKEEAGLPRMSLDRAISQPKCLSHMIPSSFRPPHTWLAKD